MRRNVNASLRLFAERRGVSAARQSPPPRAVPTIARRLQRRDVDGAIRRSRASGRRLEEGRDGPRSRRLAATVSGRASAMAPSRRPPRGTWPPGLGGLILGSTPMGGCSLQRGSKNAVDAGAERQPVGAGNRPLSVAERHPRSRRTLAGAPGGAAGVCGMRKTNPMHREWKRSRPSPGLSPQRTSRAPPRRPAPG